MTTVGGADRFAEPAPLLSTPDAPAPPGARAEWFRGAGGVRLRAALFPSADRPRGSVVINPGRTEFIEKYFEVVRELTDRGFVVLAHDWRGQGLSDRLHPEPLRGHAGPLADFLADHARLLDVFAERLPQPWFSLAHSMGGGLTCVAASRSERRYAGMAHSAPMFGLLTRGVPRGVADAAVAAQILAGGGGRVAVQIEPGGGPDAKLSHDRTRTARWHAQFAADPRLALAGPTWAWLNMATEVRRALTPRALETVGTPMLFALAGAEAVTDNAAVRRGAARMPHAEIVEIPDAWHEILMETDAVRARFWDAFDRFTAEIMGRM